MELHRQVTVVELLFEIEIRFQEVGLDVGLVNEGHTSVGTHFAAVIGVENGHGVTVNDDSFVVARNSRGAFEVQDTGTGGVIAAVPVIDTFVEAPRHGKGDRFRSASVHLDVAGNHLGGKHTIGPVRVIVTASDPDTQFDRTALRCLRAQIESQRLVFEPLDIVSVHICLITNLGFGTLFEGEISRGGFRKSPIVGRYTVALVFRKHQAVVAGCVASAGHSTETAIGLIGHNLSVLILVVS